MWKEKALLVLFCTSYALIAGYQCSGPVACARMEPRRELFDLGKSAGGIVSGGGAALSSAGSQLSNAASSGGQHVAAATHAAENTVAPAVQRAQSTASQVGGAVSGGAQHAGAEAQRAASVAAAVPQQVQTSAAAARQVPSRVSGGGAQNVGAQLANAVGSIATVAQDIKNQDNAAAVQQVGEDLNKAGVDNSCSDNTAASKFCNGVLGGAGGANSLATDALDSQTKGDGGLNEADKAGQTVTDSTVQSTGYEVNAIGQANGDPNINNCQGDSVASEACRGLGGADAVNRETSGAIQVAASTAVGEPDPTAVQEIAGAAAPAVVSDVGAAATSAGVDTSCSDGSATASLCQQLGGAPAVNGAADSLAQQAVTAAVDGAVDNAAPSSPAAPDQTGASSPEAPDQAGSASSFVAIDQAASSGGGGCCCYDLGKNPGKALCGDGSQWCGDSGCS